ncbi:hypothetical protein HAX54_046779 [Datura stramonium]|uniref:Uncharacterized protein n=1 Tax=Datura stramonium TaxID=4076 RepID=A0ABS8WK03_DATST|nr:hypothetical protein [Datura stramonium]
MRSQKASFLTHSDVVGTFGYLAPEYFMYGKWSKKESLVMWAKPKLESGNFKAILDENLNVNIEDDQVQRMILAARLCLTQAARLRPNISQILRDVEGKDGNEEANAENNNSEEYNDDEVYQIQVQRVAFKSCIS